MSTRFSTQRTPVDLEPSMLLRAEEAARMLGLGRSKVFQMLAAGELPVVRIGRCVRIPRDDLREWIKQKGQEQARLHREHWQAVFAARTESVRRNRGLNEQP